MLVRWACWFLLIGIITADVLEYDIFVDAGRKVLTPETVLKGPNDGNLILGPHTETFSYGGVEYLLILVGPSATAQNEKNSEVRIFRYGIVGTWVHIQTIEAMEIELPGPCGRDCRGASRCAQRRILWATFGMLRGTFSLVLRTASCIQFYVFNTQNQMMVPLDISTVIHQSGSELRPRLIENGFSTLRTDGRANWDPFARMKLLDSWLIVANPEMRRSVTLVSLHQRTPKFLQITNSQLGGPAWLDGLNVDVVSYVGCDPSMRGRRCATFVICGSVGHITIVDWALNSNYSKVENFELPKRGKENVGTGNKMCLLRDENSVLAGNSAGKNIFTIARKDVSQSNNADYRPWYISENIELKDYFRYGAEPLSESGARNITDLIVPSIRTLFLLKRATLGATEEWLFVGAPNDAAFNLPSSVLALSRVIKSGEPQPWLIRRVLRLRGKISSFHSPI